jgi:serine/threonine-protein kinase
LARIDGGGQGDVYRAYDKKDGDEVAIKVLKDDYASDSDWRERMLREARAMSTLRGTAVVRILDQRFTDDGALCLVMEFLRGMHFEAFLQGLEAQGHRISVAPIREIIGPIVLTIDRAHDNHILHRDIKPANIFVLQDGSSRLLDFGFAKFSRLKSFTAAGVIAGSPTYIAPESWAGNPKLMDHRVDVYGLAAVIFRALGGVPPFQDPDYGRLRDLVMKAPRPSLHQLRPDLPPMVDHWVELALAANPEGRFNRAGAMWNAFLQATSG